MRQKLNMNRFGLLIALATMLFAGACSGPEPPVFLKMENVKMDGIRNSEVFLSANAVFHNPNPIAGKLVKTDIDVVVNEIPIGKVKQDLETEIKSNAEFSVPVNINFPLKKITENKKGLLKGLLNAIIDEKALVHYEGTVTINFLKIKFETPIVHEEEVSLKN